MFKRTTSNLRREQITAHYWFLVEADGWVEGGTTFDTKLPIPGNRPPGCFLVGAWVHNAGMPEPFWVERWRWSGAGIVAVLLEKFGMRPPAVLAHQAESAKQSLNFSKPGHPVAGHPTTGV